MTRRLKLLIVGVSVLTSGLVFLAASAQTPAVPSWVSDPQVYAGRAGSPKFQVGDPVVVREEPALFYTRTPEYVRGAKGEIAALAYETPAAEDETWDRPDAKPEWMYVVRFNQSELWYGYTGTATDTLQTELPERALLAAN